MPFVGISPKQAGLLGSGLNQDQLASALAQRANSYSAKDEAEGDEDTKFEAPDLDESDMDTSSKHLYSNFTSDSPSIGTPSAGTPGTDRPVGVEPVYDSKGRRSWRIIHSSSGT